MTTTEEVLRRVAAGELSPDDALPLLDSASTATPTEDDDASDAPRPDVSEPASPPPSWGTPGESETVATGPAGDGRPAATVNVVRVLASYRSVHVVADPTVAQVAVTGEHTVRIDDGALIVQSRDNPLAGLMGWFESSTRPQTFAFADLSRSLSQVRSRLDQRLMVRVNPEMPVDLEITGANLTVSGLAGGIRLRAVASAVKLERLSGELDLELMSGSMKGTIVPTAASRVGCESSSVKLMLGPGSDLAITARNRMGKVVLPHTDAPSRADRTDRGGEDVSTARVGSGRHDLSIEAVMSSVVLTDDSGAGL